MELLLLLLSLLFLVAFFVRCEFILVYIRTNKSVPVFSPFHF